MDDHGVHPCVRDGSDVCSVPVLRAANGPGGENSPVRSAAVPKLSTADGLLQTVVRDPLVPGTKGTSPLDPFHYARIAPDSGQIVRSARVGVGSLYDTLQMAGTITRGGAYLQGTVSGILRITAG
ncbi:MULTISPECIES: hypothetical protein [Streptomyces]|uniref:Uncharacterized protein n=1 Tax=Streptomyces salyersiae TaxID=3075530 RepID=A0ABU2RM27_9ACTN|nr:hypothetical protein [Streptomyces sp. DSM 41770]MDT0429333.1 hypothetical protein [Streptomyces sp. DSM 41770]